MRPPDAGRAGPHGRPNPNDDDDPGKATRQGSRRGRHDRCTCGVGHPHPSPATPDAWRHRHGIDLLDLTDTRRLNEITALKAGRRLCDLVAS